MGWCHSAGEASDRPGTRILKRETNADAKTMAVDGRAGKMTEMQKDNSNQPRLAPSEEVSGWDVVLAIATRIVSVVLSILLTSLTLHFSFELLDYIQLDFQQNNLDGFDKLGMLVISTLAFIPIAYAYFRILRYYIEKLIKHIGGSK